MELAGLMEQQKAFFLSGVTRDVQYRQTALALLEQLLNQWEEQLLRALSSDLHKSNFEGYMTEVGMVREELRYVRKHLPQWAKNRRIPTLLSQFPARSVIMPQPYGSVLIMAPWNYPLQLCLTPLIGAIAAGNCAVVKPSAYAPATSRVLAEMIGSSFEPAFIAVVEGGREQNAALLDQPFDYIFFTGSVAVGKLVMEKAASRLIPVTLELGGKSPCIVDETADLRLAARRIAFGKFLNAGQTCVAPDYVLVQQKVKKEMVLCLQQAVAEFYPGGDFGSMPVIVNEKHYARLQGLLQGAHCAFGGSGDPARRFLEPTVLDAVTPESPVMQQEIFGPILPVLSYETLTDAIAFVNERPHPLALYVFTADKKTAHTVLERIPFGGGCVNDTLIHLANPRMPFGGVGQSGMGSYHGKASFDTFTHDKCVVYKGAWPDLTLRYPPYTEKKEKQLRRFLK